MAITSLNSIVPILEGEKIVPSVMYYPPTKKINISKNINFGILTIKNVGMFDEPLSKRFWKRAFSAFIDPTQVSSTYGVSLDVLECLRERMLSDENINEVKLRL